MFKLIWQAIVGGNPTSWAIGALVLALYSASLFGAGYVVATHDALKIETQAVPKAQAVQQKQDKKQHAAAVKANAPVKAAETANAPRIITITKTIHDLEPAPQKTCELPADVSEQLNKAAQYPAVQ